jgi:hypothetical protein
MHSANPDWSSQVGEGDVIVACYADVLGVGFQNRADAKRFLGEFRERLAKSAWNYIRTRRD